MATIDYSLFRVKFVLPPQQSWLHYPISPRDIFLSSLRGRGDSQVRQGYTWHIGNVRFFSPTSGYFAIGRTTRSTIEKYDTVTGDFVEEELETSPYTHCVFDADIGFIGIARKPSLSPTPSGIARRIEDLLSQTKEVRDNDIRVEIAPIPDPESFLKDIREAFAVLQFTATFHGPNPFDADEYFQKPLSGLLAAADGKKGRTQIEGDDLNRDVVESITKSTAATGNEASARIKRKRNARTTKIHLKGNNVGTVYEEESHTPQKALADLQSMYQRVSQ